MENYMYIVWTVLLIVFIIAEVATLGLTFIWFAVGALAALIISFFIKNIYIQGAIFIIVTAITLIFTKKVFVNHLKLGQNKTNVYTLIDKKAVVTKKITTSEFGQVKVNNQIWTAKTETSDILEDKTVIIKKIEGVKLIVEEINEWR